MTNFHKRCGKTALLAAVNVLDSKVISQCQPRDRHTEWLKFLRLIDRETRKDRTLHFVCDSYAKHKHPVVQERLTKHPRFVMYFTPASASWPDMVERV